MASQLARSTQNETPVPRLQSAKTTMLFLFSEIDYTLVYSVALHFYREPTKYALQLSAYTVRTCSLNLKHTKLETLLAQHHSRRKTLPIPEETYSVTAAKNKQHLLKCTATSSSSTALLGQVRSNSTTNSTSRPLRSPKKAISTKTKGHTHAASSPKLKNPQNSRKQQHTNTTPKSAAAKCANKLHPTPRPTSRAEQSSNHLS